jgi:hypothetical protein
MGTRTLAGIIGVTVLLAAGLSRADSATTVDPLDGTHSVGAAGGPRSEGGPLLPREGRVPAPGAFQSPVPPTTQFGTPSPPNHITPAPVLPFHPNRPLMPSPSAPSHPPNPARAETRANPPPSSGGGRPGR